jgi:hypothetical protein
MDTQVYLAKTIVTQVVKKFHCCDYKSLPLTSIPSQINAFHNLTYSFLKTHFNIILLSVPSLPSDPYSLDLRLK